MTLKFKVSKPLALLGLLVGGQFLSGCTATRAHYGASGLRQKSADFYEQQMMENLVRVMQGRFFVHIDLDTLNSTNSSKFAGGVEGGETVKHVDNLSALRLLTSAASEVSRPFTVKLNPEGTDSLTINTDVTIGKANVYEPYMRFILLKNSEERLREVSLENFSIPKSVRSVVKRTPGESLGKDKYVPGTLRRCDGDWYYVPSAYRNAWFDLSMALMIRPEPPAVAKPKGEGVFETQQKSIESMLQKSEESQKKTRDKVDELRALQLNQ